jgi:hypothetical protein
LEFRGKRDGQITNACGALYWLKERTKEKIDSSGLDSQLLSTWHFVGQKCHVSTMSVGSRCISAGWNCQKFDSEWKLEFAILMQF